MAPLPSRLTHLTALTLTGLLCLTLRSDAALSLLNLPSARMKVLPRRTLWVWERPEDLRSLDPHTTAVAWLDQTIVIGSGPQGPTVASKPRRQPIAFPANSAQIPLVRIAVVRIPVVRIEVVRGTSLDAMPATENARQSYEATVGNVVALLLVSAQRPGIAAFQVDFDATRSQRDFYRRVLRELRAQMPVNLPLSMTALASWCSYDDWIANLPVDEAVPMLFRMEPDRRRAPADLDAFQIREPLCRGSLGISTRERWPDNLAGKRIYVFPDRGWRSDLTLLADRKLP
jgi:hypothetical protein